MGAEELLKPVVELPKGLPPKNLIVWVFALLMIMIVALALLTTASEPTLKTADEVVRDVASKLNANDKVLLDKGTTWVDDAYSSSGLATQIAQGVVSPPTAFSLSSAANVSPPVAPTPSAIPFLNGLGEQAHQSWLNPAPTKVEGRPSSLGGPLPGLPAMPTLPSLPSMPGAPSSTPSSSPSSMSTVDVAKEVEAINSKMMVADFDDRSGPTAASPWVAPQALQAHKANANVGLKSSSPAPTPDVSAKTEDLNALDALVQKTSAEAGWRDAGSKAMVSGLQGLGGAISAGSAGSAGAEELWRQTMGRDDDKPSLVSLRSKDGAFIKEFSTDLSIKRGLRSTALESPFAILEGSVIPAILGRDVNSDLPGVITATVAQTIYDSVHSNKALICKGAKLIGRYSNEIRGGQSRLLFAFARLILNDGRSFNLAGFDGSDVMGGAGARADVDNHFFKLYGASLAIGVLSDQVSKQNLSTQGLYSQPSATGQILVQTTKEILQRNQDVAPTLSVSHGTRINVEVRRDLVFPEQGLPSCG